MASPTTALKQITFYNNIGLIGNNFSIITNDLISGTIKRLNKIVEIFNKLPFWINYYEKKLTELKEKKDYIGIECLNKLNHDIIDDARTHCTENEEIIEKTNLIITDLLMVKKILEFNRFKKDGFIKEGFSEKINLILVAVKNLTIARDQVIKILNN